MEIPYLTVEDPAHPLLSRLIKGYPGSVTVEEDSLHILIPKVNILFIEVICFLLHGYRIKTFFSYKFWIKDANTQTYFINNFKELYFNHFIDNYCSETKNADGMEIPYLIGDPSIQRIHYYHG